MRFCSTPSMSRAPGTRKSPPGVFSPALRSSPVDGKGLTSPYQVSAAVRSYGHEMPCLRGSSGCRSGLLLACDAEGPRTPAHVVITPASAGDDGPDPPAYRHRSGRRRTGHRGRAGLVRVERSLDPHGRRERAPHVRRPPARRSSARPAARGARRSRARWCWNFCHVRQPASLTLETGETVTINVTVTDEHGD